jgi:hypothetical protein
VPLVCSCTISPAFKVPEFLTVNIAGVGGGVGIGGVKATKQRALPIELAALGQGNRDGDDRRRSRSVA